MVLQYEKLWYLLRKSLLILLWSFFFFEDFFWFFRFFEDFFFDFSLSFLITLRISYHFYIWVAFGEWRSIYIGCSGIDLYLAAAPIHVHSSNRLCTGSLGGYTGVLLSLAWICWSWLWTLLLGWSLGRSPFDGPMVRQSSCSRVPGCCGLVLG